jgi:hypothetical protein
MFSRNLNNFHPKAMRYALNDSVCFNCAIGMEDIGEMRSPKTVSNAK